MRGERVDGVGQREPDGLQRAREPDALDRLGPIVAVAGRGAVGRRQDPDALVEPHRVDADAGLSGDFTDLHAFRP
jgi:hypothetical protein